MLTFAARRLLGLLLTLVAVSVVVFVVLEVLPGDVAEIILGTEAREDTLAALRRQLGLDRPAHARYLAWIGGLLTGELGLSHTYGVPVAGLIAERLAVTVPLALIAFVLSCAIAVPLGMFAASRRGAGLGHMMIEWAIGECRRRGCGLVQLTMNKTRKETLRFYESLGFVATHEGFKLTL